MLKKYLGCTAACLGFVALLIATFDAYQAEGEAHRGGLTYFLLMPFTPLVENRFPVVFLPMVILLAPLLSFRSLRPNFLPVYLAAFTAGVTQLLLYFFLLPSGDMVFWIVLVVLPIAILEALSIFAVIALARLATRASKRTR